MFKIIFSWWNRQTFGTLLNTLIFGVKVGVDDFGNTYYRNKSDTKRWVIYNDVIDASKIPPEWHSWIHRLIKTTPDKIKFSNYQWQKNILKILLVHLNLIIQIRKIKTLKIKNTNHGNQINLYSFFVFMLYK